MPPSESFTLPPLPRSFGDSRRSLHQVAERVVAPAQKPDNEIALRATEGGFGTPVFEYEGRSCQVRVDGAELVYLRGEQERRAPLESLAQAAELVDELLPREELDGVPLAIEADSVAALAAWFALGQQVLSELAAEAPADGAPTDPLLWPEHFDLAIESGAETAGARANYGFSPGDEDHAEPYLYVGPWSGEASGDLWNAQGFNGAELAYAELQTAGDPQALALEFCRARRNALDSMEDAS